MKRIFLIPIALLAVAASAHAHHGLDFLLLQDATFPQPWSGSFFNNSEWTRERALDEYATEPGLHLGVLPGLSAGVMSHFADMGDGWAYSSTTPYVVINLLPVEIKGVRVALWTGYEFASEDETHTASPSSKKTRSTSRRTATAAVTAAPSTAVASTTNSTTKGKSAPGASRSRHTGGTTGGGGPDAPATGTHDHPVAAPAAAPPPRRDETNQQVVAEPVVVPIVEPVHVHEGIHRHGESGLHSRLIIEADLSKHDKIVANLINFTPEHGKGAWGYGVGIRHAFHHDFAMSVEAVGDFDASLEHQALVAAHWSPVHWLAIKVGVGVGVTPEASDVAVHTGIVWRF